MLRPKPGEQLLEVGPGAGYYSLAVAQRLQPDGYLALVDVDNEMLDATIRLPRARGLDRVSQRHLSDSASLPFGDSSFHGAFLVAVLGEVKDRPAAPGELHRVLRPGRRFVVGETRLDPHAVTLDQPRREAEAAGFQLDDQIGGRSYVSGFHPV